MPRIGEQGERTAIETACNFGDHVDRGEQEHNREASPPALARAMVMPVRVHAALVGTRSVRIKISYLVCGSHISRKRLRVARFPRANHAKCFDEKHECRGSLLRLQAASGIVNSTVP
jgi:hypothetical protein